jgi:hypothetical protein
MNKWSKRIKKYVNDDSSILVIGQAFGILIGLSNIFKTVFVISYSDNKIKRKNIIYRENFNDINDIGSVSIIMVDLDKVKELEMMPTYWTRFHPLVLIEGNEPIDRSKSAYLYKYGYRCIDQLGFSHVWKKI